jgi:hypothetical protein
MNRKILASLTITVLALAMLMTVAPALASQTSTSYSFGGISVGVPNTGNTWTSADKIEHKTGGESINYDFGHPWGPGYDYSDIATPHWNLNIDPNSKNYLTGSGTSRFETTYATGKLDLSLQYKFEGLVTSITYQGPTFTVTLPGHGTVTITHGQTYTGAFLLGSGKTEGTGAFATGNVRVSETVTLATPLAGPLAGLDIIWGTGTATTIG